MTHEFFMRAALEQAQAALVHEEVPVGAVVVLNNEIIAAAHNQNITLKDPSAHAEMLVLREAGKKLNNYRLEEAILYVTLEPCLMCVGAMIHARIKRVVFGALDPKTGACGSRCEAHRLDFHNHHLEVVGGVLAEDCGRILKDFFRARRT